LKLSTVIYTQQSILRTLTGFTNSGHADLDNRTCSLLNLVVGGNWWVHRKGSQGVLPMIPHQYSIHFEKYKRNRPRQFASSTKYVNKETEMRATFLEYLYITIQITYYLCLNLPKLKKNQQST